MDACPFNMMFIYIDQKGVSKQKIYIDQFYLLVGSKLKDQTIDFLSNSLNFSCFPVFWTNYNEMRIIKWSNYLTK